MKAQTLGFLNKAERAIAATESLLRDGLPEFACGRAYYSMFYVAEALLVEEGLRFRKHSGVHAAFGERFAATAEMDPKFHRWLLDAFDARLAGDYGFEAVLTAEDVGVLLERSREFLAAARTRLGG